MSEISKVILLCSITLLFVSCTTTDEKNDVNEPGAADVILCEEPRPQICTREYDPVCAIRQDGTIKTYSTGCTSCSDTSVVSYKKGQC